jgi:hypothetical protein
MVDKDAPDVLSALDPVALDAFALGAFELDALGLGLRRGVE